MPRQCLTPLAFAYSHGVDLLPVPILLHCDARPLSSSASSPAVWAGLAPRVGALLALGPVAFLALVSLSNGRWLPEQPLELGPW